MEQRRNPDGSVSLVFPESSWEDIEITKTTKCVGGITKIGDMVFEVLDEGGAMGSLSRYDLYKRGKL